MPIDPVKATTAAPRTASLAWDHKDVLLYHLGIGAGSHQGGRSLATDPGELRYTLESRLHVLPSFATVAGGGRAVAGALTMPGIDIDLAAVLHGGQTVTLHRPLPIRATGVTQTSRVAAVYDKGKAAVIVLRSDTEDDDGPLWTGVSEIFVKGEGGFGGERGTTERLPAPDTEPGLTVDRHVREDQALLYRLSGDWNPLHADPEFARLAGFDKPILHGLCSYGVVLKAVVDTVLSGDVARVRSYATRFAGVVYPGETLRVRIWRDTPGPGRVQVTAGVVERDDAPVLTDTLVEYA
ncbi:MaoC/PaaZ C-terminal domain-containing protein [Streptomyces abikoensis]|uniref:MaoC/PaaZ C-terminal domain-containing protein n=1 Tax=Streptomyces abikoensis TaxID=97398 RepID=UPI0033EAA238